MSDDDVLRILTIPDSVKDFDSLVKWLAKKDEHVLPSDAHVFPGLKRLWRADPCKLTPNCGHSQKLVGAIFAAVYALTNAFVLIQHGWWDTDGIAASVVIAILAAPFIATYIRWLLWLSHRQDFEDRLALIKTRDSNALICKFLASQIRAVKRALLDPSVGLLPQTRRDLCAGVVRLENALPTVAQAIMQLDRNRAYVEEDLLSVRFDIDMVKTLFKKLAKLERSTEAFPTPILIQRVEELKRKIFYHVRDLNHRLKNCYGIECSFYEKTPSTQRSQLQPAS